MINLTKIDKVSIIFFIFAFMLYILYQSVFFKGIDNQILFWISIPSMILIVVCQIFKGKIDYKIILLEIFIIYVISMLTYQLGYYGLRGNDSYIDLELFKLILNSGNFELNIQESGLENVASWPVLHILSSILALFTNIYSTIHIAKFLPIFLSSLIILPLYLLANKIYSDKRGALLSCLIFGTIPKFISFESLFVRESIGLFFLILGFYLIYKSKNDHRFVWLFICIIPIIILSHHFTTFLFVILIAIYLLVAYFTPYFKEKIGFEDLTGKIKLNNLLILFSVSMLSYWLYNAIMIWNSLGSFLNEAMGFSQSVTYAEMIGLFDPIITYRGLITYYGFFLFVILFTLLLIIKILKDKNSEKIEDVSFTLFFIFCGFYGFISLYVSTTVIYPDRLLTFGWLFAIIPMAGIFRTVQRNSNQKLKKLLILFVISFMFFNLYNMDIDYINKSYDSMGGIATYKDYQIANTLIFPDSYQKIDYDTFYYGDIGVMGAIYDMQGIHNRRVGRTIFNIENFENSSKIAIINEKTLLKDLDIIKEKSEKDYKNIMRILSYKESIKVNKIMDIGDRKYVLKGGSY